MKTLAELEDAVQVYRLRRGRKVRGLPSNTRQLARCLDGRRTLEEACKAAGLSLTHGLTLASRLCASGALEAVGVQPEPDFTTEEEAFFAEQPIEPLEDEPPVPGRVRSWLSRFVERVEVSLHIPTIAHESVSEG